MRWLDLVLIFIVMIPYAAAQDSGSQSVDLEFPEQSEIQDPQFQAKAQKLIDVLQTNPDNIQLKIQLAGLYQNHRYYAKAVEIYQQIGKNHPETAEAHFRLGQIWGAQLTDPDRSLSELKEAVRLAPDRIEYREELASIYYRLQRFPPALEQVEEILKRDPRNDNALYQKAVILYTQGHIPEAENLVNQLPNHEHARVLKALIVQQRAEDAKPLYEAILHDFPQNLRARYEYGKLLFQEKQYAKAQEIFAAIIDEDPFYQHAIFYLVKMYLLAGDNQKAALAKQSLDTINRMGRSQRNYYRSYFQHHPDTPETHRTMGLLYLEIGRGNLAAKEFHRVLEFDSRQTEALFYLAQIAMSSRDYREALSYLENYLHIRDDSADIHALAAQCYLELKDAPNARKQLEAALRIDPKNLLAVKIKELWQKCSAGSKPNSEKQ